MARLTATAGPLAGRSFRIGEDSTLGRGAYCDVRIDDSTISRQHARVRRENGEWRVRDLGSANGTMIDGKPIDGEQTLADGARLLLGEVELIFAADDARVAGDADAAREQASRLFPRLVARLDLLARIAALPAKRADATQLLGEALDAILASGADLERVAIFRSRPGADHLVAVAARERGPSSTMADAERVALATLHHTDGFAGRADALGIAPRESVALPASVLAAPLRHGGEMLGVLLLESIDAMAWQHADLDFGAGIAAVLAVLLDVERGEDPERRVNERDLHLARRIQQRFLPQAPPTLSGYRIADAYLPARAVGGDLYDYFQYLDGRIGILLGDVSGKAVSAALVMARLGMALRLAAPTAGGPGTLLAELNRILCGELDSGMFVTAFALALDPASGELEIANAGQPPPLLRDPDGSVSALAAAPSAPLGAARATVFADHAYVLYPGSTLLLYSDGLSEAENAAHDQFGVERVAGVLGPAVDASKAVSALLKAVAAFSGAAAATDDLTAVAISRSK